MALQKLPEEINEPEEKVQQKLRELEKQDKV